MAVTLESTTAKVRDPEKVREILDSYEVRGVEIQLTKESGGWKLAMEVTAPDNDEDKVPRALHRAQWPDEEQSTDEEEEEDGCEETEEEEDSFEETEWDKRFREKGEEGFVALLQELAPTIETPLLILHLLRLVFGTDK